MFCISVSYKRAPLQVRQQFAFSMEEQAYFLSELSAGEIITGGVVVSTCNRCEVYFTADMDKMDEVEDVLSTVKNIQRENIKKYGLYYQGKKAVRHLFKVACGLDSMVLGEDEILHQVKEAYCLAKNGGYTNSELNIIFQGAFHCAKRSKTSTGLSNTPVSVGTLTANAIERHMREMPFNGMQYVLVIGATGKIGSIVAKDLIAKGIPVIGTTRKRHQAEGLFLQDNVNMEWMDFDKRYQAVSETAAVVSATASPHYTLTKQEFLCHAHKEKHYLLVDLAVPCDIDRSLGMEENITLLDIDHFNELSKENSGIRLGELGKAEEILQVCVDDVLKRLYIRSFKKQMEGKYEDNDFFKMICYLRDVLDSDQLSHVLERIYQEEKGEQGWHISRL